MAPSGIFHDYPHHGAIYFVLIAATILVGIGILAALQAIPSRYRKTLIAIFTFLGGLFYAAEFFVPVKHGTTANVLTKYLLPVANISQVIVSFTIGLGIVSLIGMHLKTISRQRTGWGFSIVLVLSFVVMAIFHIINEYWGATVLVHKQGIFRADMTTGDVYTFLFKGGLISLDSAMFALIGFFIISASYRAFRIRSFESSLLMISALIVMLGQVTLGSWLTGHLPAEGFGSNFRFENMAQYILLNINTPAQRAVTFGIALGVLATSLRLWLSLERGFYFDQES